MSPWMQLQRSRDELDRVSLSDSRAYARVLGFICTRYPRFGDRTASQFARWVVVRRRERTRGILLDGLIRSGFTRTHALYLTYSADLAEGEGMLA